MDMRPPFARQQRTDAPYHGEPYDQTQRWQSNMSRNSFAQAAQLDSPSSAPASHTWMTCSRVTNFFDAVKLKPEPYSDTVHGRMLVAAQPELWDLSVACFSIASLQLSETVDIVHLLKHYKQLESFSNDDSR